MMSPWRQKEWGPVYKERQALGRMLLLARTGGGHAQGWVDKAEGSLCRFSSDRFSFPS